MKEKYMVEVEKVVLVEMESQILAKVEVEEHPPLVLNTVVEQLS
jgi:hypothetical protein